MSAGEHIADILCKTEIYNYSPGASGFITRRVTCSG